MKSLPVLGLDPLPRQSISSLKLISKNNKQMLTFTIGIFSFFFVNSIAAKVKVSICDPANVLNIKDDQVFDRTLLTHSVVEAAGLPSDGDLLTLINRTKFLEMTPCIRFLDFGSYAANAIVKKTQNGKCKSYPTTGIMGGFRSDYLLNYVKAGTASDSSTQCTDDNTVTFILPRLTHASQMNRNLTVWIVSILIILILGTCWWMMAMDETKPDDLDDNFTDLLFNCPEMQLADESILDDEPWEEGGLDY